MRRIVPAVVLALVGLAALGGSVQAQSAAYGRKGFWFSGGVGYGSAGIGCHGCSGFTREDGVSAFLSLGGTISPHFLVGFESSGWSKSEDGSTVSFGTGTLSGRYYPSLTGGFFAKVGVGLGAQSVSASGASDTRTGPGLLGGVGYDVPIGRKVALTPTVSYSGGWLGNVGGASGYRFDVLQVALGVTLP